jgi:hypothetical protein
MVLPDVPLCELDALALLSDFPKLLPTEMKHSTIFFTDAHGRHWALDGPGTLLQTPVPGFLSARIGPILGDFDWANDSRMATISGGCMSS